MVQAVNLPDGSQVNFPDEMSIDDIQAAMPNVYKQAQDKAADTKASTEDAFSNESAGSAALFAAPVIQGAAEGASQGANFQPFGDKALPGSPEALANAPFQGVSALFGAATGAAEQVGQQFGYKGAGADVEALTEALPMLHGAVPHVPEENPFTPIDRSNPPVLDQAATEAKQVANKIDATNQQEDALGRLALGLRNPTTLTPEQTAAALAKPDAGIKAVAGSDTDLTPEHIENLKSLSQDALDSGVPVQGIEAMVKTHLPSTYDHQSVIDQLIPPSARNISEGSPEVAEATGVSPITTQQILLQKKQIWDDSQTNFTDVTSPNVVQDAIETTPLTVEQTQNVLGNNAVTKAAKGIYNGFANSYGILDNLNRVWAKTNDIDIGRNDILEMADTAMAKNIGDRGNYGGLSYLGEMDGSSPSVYRNQAGSSELVEDTNVQPYMTVKQNAVKAGIQPEDLNRINLARNALDDYTNLQRVAVEHATTIAENNIKIRQLKEEQAQPENQGFFKKYDIQRQIESAVRESAAASKAASELAKRESYMSKEDALATMHQYENNPAAKSYIDGLNKIHGALLDDLVVAGKITPELAQRLKMSHPNYVPAYRTADDYTFDLGKGQGWRGALPRAFLKRDIGERGADQIDVEGNIVKNILSTVNKRESAQIRASLFNNLNKILDDNAWDLAFRESKANVNKAIIALKDNAKDRMTAEEIQPHNEKRIENYRTVNFDINGKQIELSVKDEQLYKALANSYGQFESGNPMLKAAIFLARLKREGIIDLDPTFPIRNAMRGMMDFPVNSRRMIPMKDYTPVVSQIKTAVGTLFDQKFYDKYSINYGFGNKLSKDYGMKSTDDIVKMVKSNEAPSGIVHGTTSFMHDVNSRVDAGTRILQYKVLYNKLLSEGKTPAQAHEAAMIASKEAHLRFNQRGANNSLNVITQTVPLMRTYINAMDKSLKMGIYSPVTFAAGGAQIFMVYKAVQMYNNQFKDKDGIPFQQKLDQRIKADGMPIYYGNGQNQFFKWPLGWIAGRSMPAWDKSLDFTTQYLGKVFPATLSDKATQLIKQTPEMAGKVTGKQVADAWMDWAFHWMSPESALPPPMAATIGLIQNKDDNGNSIIPQSLNNPTVPAHLQYFVNGTDASLVSFTNDLHNNYGIDLSPGKAQFIARELMGTFGETSMKAGAHLYAAMSGANPPAPERGDIPGFKLFSGNTSDVPHTGIESKYHNVGDYLKQIQDQANVLKQKSADYPASSLEYNQFLQDHATELYWSAKYKEADKALTKVRNAMEQTITATPGHLMGVQETNPSIFGDEKKRTEITHLREEMQHIQQGVLQGIVDDLDKGRGATNDIWGHADTHAPATDMLNHLLPSQNPKKTLDKSDEKSDNSPISNFLKGINPVSDAQADDMIPANTQFDHFPPAQIQTLSQEQYNPGFFEKFLPHVRQGLDSMYKDAVINYTIKQEGGDKFTETQGDRGGATKYGITLKTLQEENPKATAEDVKNLTEAQAKDIYDKKYWTKGQVDKMPIGIQDVVFDMNVNTGLGGSTIIIQRALRDLGSDVDVDGKLGNNTLNALNDFKVSDIRAAITRERQRWYADIAKHDPSQAKFLPGWTARTASMEQIPDDITNSEA